MPTLILVRHGRSTANTAGVLAGRAPGVALDEHGAAQAAGLPVRLSQVPLTAVVSSPLQRCRETVAPLLEARPWLTPHIEDRISECDYGDWSGRKLAELSDEPLMEVVQQHPSAAAFPGGESMRAMQARAVDAVRDWNARIDGTHGPEAAYLMCSHGDLIKSLVADALGMHLDLFQRISVEPCSVTAIRYTRLRPYLVRLGDTGDFGSLVPRADGGGAAADRDAAVGGGAGAA
ncbi:probable phosphomutase, MSMEG_4193 family [Streptomyces sp. 2224.1]|uniref:histidine phosphatase family protein n=1 Tax=unclassified Streptomyces TaxID=2593676 RepID=UPI00087DF7D8|nr:MULTISPECIES: histidine phosphatase family protein [unclassified Streptomyces]PBC81494.1 putative phosphomutase (TIGR03848 family) [Streptomyces sp. 2321.6]SDR54715.1 probable phosphomutase, MSMEG_4193 family [Streptomyces sp. KS_16]SEC17606.1 probable phosphomutase, MSMEG_4193 family [Streptomyces sp. 2133.1]SED14164.1 probable phosphomutase, MSMEG_4193 family [Streptomyces sp. 2224.1]SEF07426.1 probable phosphomutase, MSMEG_4193 family [Streptomyces sp. 2112.3]